MYQIYVHHFDKTTSVIRATEDQRSGFLALAQQWFDNGLITGWAITEKCR